jgi:hypothetical protein
MTIHFIINDFSGIRRRITYLVIINCIFRSQVTSISRLEQKQEVRWISVCSSYSVGAFGWFGRVMFVNYHTAILAKSYNICVIWTKRFESLEFYVLSSNPQVPKKNSLKICRLSRWYINITIIIMDVIHCPVFYLKLNSTLQVCPCLTGNTLRLRNDTNKLMLSVGLWR